MIQHSSIKGYSAVNNRKVHLKIKARDCQKETPRVKKKKKSKPKVTLH